MTRRAAEIVQMTGLGVLLEDRLATIRDWGWVETPMTDAYRTFMEQAQWLTFYEYGDGIIEHPEDFEEDKAMLGGLEWDGVHMSSPDEQEFIVLFRDMFDSECAYYACRSGLWNDAFGDDPSLRAHGSDRVQGTVNAPSVGGFVNGRSMRDSPYEASLFLRVEGPTTPERKKKYEENMALPGGTNDFRTILNDAPPAKPKRWWN